MQHLLLLLPVRDENWFQQLIHALQFNGYQGIVNVIYPPGMACRPSSLKLTLLVMNIMSMSVMSAWDIMYQTLTRSND